MEHNPESFQGCDLCGYEGFPSLSPSGNCGGLMPVTKILLNNLQIIVVFVNIYAIVYPCLMERLNAEVMKKTLESGCGLRRKYGVAEKLGKGRSSPERIRCSPDDFFRPRRIRPFFLSALALAAADAPFALGDFAFNSRIKNPTPSQSVAVSRSDFVKGPVKVSRPISEKVKAIHSEKTVKSVFARFSNGNVPRIVEKRLVENSLCGLC